MLLSAALLLPPSSNAQFVVVGQACGASGLSAIANDGTPVVCRGNPLVWTAVGGGGGTSIPGSIYLSPNCGGTSSCITIPASGGCLNNASVTNNSNVVTFTSGFPVGIKVGMIAWVQLGNVGGICGVSGVSTTVGNPPQALGLTNYIGLPRTSGGTQVTVTAISPGVSVTLSQNSNATVASSATWLFYMPNIYSQMGTACAAAASSALNSGQEMVVHVAQGFYGLDNTGNGSTAACIGGAGIVGEGLDKTDLFTPPWYNHEFDVGTIFQLTSVNSIYLKDFSLDGGWTLLSVAIGRGTPISLASCVKMDRVAIRGYSYGNGDTSEMLYNGAAGADDCYISNSIIRTANRGIFLQNPKLQLINDNISTGSNVVMQGTATGALLEIYGGYYETLTYAPDRSMFAFPCTGCGSPTSAFISISDATLCELNANSGSIPIFNIGAGETSGEIRLNNVRINASNYCSGVTTNATPLTIPSGWTARVINSDLVATGTGNTINNSGTFLDGGSNKYSGGAGFTGAGTYFLNPTSFNTAPTLTGTGACATITTQKGGVQGQAICTGATAASTFILGNLATAPNGWSCSSSDVTHTLAGTQSAVSTTGCTISFTSVTTSDVITFSASPF